jgi:hypothetical protein
MATQTFYTKGDKKLQAGSNTSAIVQEFENERDTLETAFQAIRDEIDGGVAPDATAALLPGRAGSQVLNGGTAASEDLTLQSTADATKGDINVGTDDSAVNLGGSGSAIGVLGTAAIAKAAPIAALADTTTGTPAPGLVAIPAVGGSGATAPQEAAINDNFASILTHVEAIRSTMSAYGWF